MKKYVFTMALLVPCTLVAQGVEGAPEKTSETVRPTAASINQVPSAPNLSSAPGWHKIAGTALKGGSENASPCPPDNYGAYGYPFGSACQAVYNAWNSAAADTKRNRLIIWGGGHGDYAGNELYSLELTTTPPSLIRLNPPSPPNTSNNPCPSPEALTDGRPNSRHTYDSLAYLPDQDVMFSVGGGVGMCGFGSRGAWALSMGSVTSACAPNCNSTWVQQSSGPDGYGFITAWDSLRHLYWINDQNNLWSFDPASNKWMKRGPGTANNFNAIGAFDPVEKYFINVGLDAGGGQSIVYYSVASNSNYKQINPGINASCAPGVTSSYPGVAWDPIDNVVVVYPNAGSVLYLLNPRTWTCTTETYGSTQGADYPQSSSATGNGALKRFNYFPSLDIYVLCNDPYNDCWYLRRHSRVK
jgi:hypothetical protein